MNPPPNPNEQQARADISAYQRAVRLAGQGDEAPAPPDLAAALSIVAARWPEAMQYAATARIDRMRHARGWCWCVTVEV